MSTSLIPTNTGDVMTTAKALAESGYFTDARSAAQAFVKVLAGAELGVPAFQSMNGIHIIQGKPVMGAGLIASVIKKSGKYNYRVTEQTDIKCSIDFYEGGEKIGNSTFTIEQARKAGVKNLDKFPQNMLFARAISNGAKWYTPDVFGGPVYTDGEIEHSTPATTFDVVETTAEVVQEPRIQAPPANLTEELTAWQAKVDTLDTDLEFQRHLGKLKEAPLKSLGKTDMSQMFTALCKAAEEKGIGWNKETKTFGYEVVEIDVVENKG